MSNILFLAHRLPFPPNKGDKVRSYHLLKHLAARHRVFLGTFIDDPEDEAHVDTVRRLCADLHIARLNPLRARIGSLRGLLTGEPLTLPYYRDRRLADWVGQTCRGQAMDAAVVFSSAMAQYVHDTLGLRRLVDFVDVDSAKWTQYAAAHHWPLSWLYRREGRRLLAFERAVALRATRGFFVTDAETELFRRLAPECGNRVEAMGNGVDAEYFSPAHGLPSPYDGRGPVVVFTGAMDYWPNVDAVTWFTREVLPLLNGKWPGLQFWIVGRSPTAAVQALAGERVKVTGTVPDVRPYLQHADVVAAPLRVARGIQNKILEAVAMARPVVASAVCAGPIGESLGQELLAAESAVEFAGAVDSLLADPLRATEIGAAARKRVLARFSWQAHLSGIDGYLPVALPARAAEAA